MYNIDSKLKVLINWGIRSRVCEIALERGQAKRIKFLFKENFIFPVEGERQIGNYCLEKTAF